MRVLGSLRGYTYRLHRADHRDSNLVTQLVGKGWKKILLVRCSEVFASAPL